MKTNTHPVIHNVTLTCTCGNTIETTSTRMFSRIEVCNQCHPFYTKSAKVIDQAGRVAKFNQRYGKSRG